MEYLKFLHDSLEKKKLQSAHREQNIAHSSIIFKVKHVEGYLSSLHVTTRDSSGWSLTVKLIGEHLYNKLIINQDAYWWLVIH